MKYFLGLAFALLIAVAIVASQPAKKVSFPPPSTVEVAQQPGFYYWKTSLVFGHQENQLARENGIQQLYIRAFDVQWSPSQNEALPVAPIQLPEWGEESLYLQGLKISPVVFIDNRVFKSNVNKVQLARGISMALKAMEKKLVESAAISLEAEGVNLYDYNENYNLQNSRRNEIAQNITQWQIDCDWTPATQTAYFDFLKILQKMAPEKNISATIRLHQYRDRDANGIPPVEKGLLMCYNMAPVHDINTQNAIFDLSLLSGYLKTEEPYPISLDAALPLFSWVAAFQQSEFAGIFNSLAFQGYSPNDSPKGQIAVLKADTTLQNKLLRTGDLIRFDGPKDQQTLTAAVNLLRQKPEIKQLHFFDWQPQHFQQFQIKTLISSFYNQQ